MIYKKYGKTGKEVSVIGFGCMRFKKTNGSDQSKKSYYLLPDFDNAAGTYDIEACAELAVKANELGVNYYDTSPVYCDSMSEIIIGRAIKEFKNPFYISDKSDARNADDLRRDLERTLKRLGLEKINFYNLWSIMDLDDYRQRMSKNGPYEGALKAKEEGLIEHLCFSTHCNGKEIAEIVSHQEFEGVTVGYNILNFPFRQEGIQAAYQYGLGVATMNPCGGGLIPECADSLQFLKGEDDKTVVEAALRFNASHKEITTVLSGISSMDEVIANVRVGNSSNILSDEKIDELKKKLSSKMDSLCTGCRYCEHCPMEVGPSKFMQAYNQMILKNQDAGIDYLKWHWHSSPDDATKCIGCGECERRCTQHLPIINRLKEISKWI